MKTQRLAAVVLLLSGGLCAAGAHAEEGKSEREKPQTIEVLHTWSGILADAALRKHLPDHEFVLDQGSWEGLWRAWRRREDVPAVDFQQQMVLVFTAEGPNHVGYDRLTLDDRGNVRAKVMSTLIGGPGFGYLMVCIPREGVKSVNGTPVPGVVESPPWPGPDVVESPPPPIVELDRVRPKRSAWEGSTWKKPFVLKSEKDAAGYFEGDELARLTRQVDFGKQFVLLFVWRGSGQDRLEMAVAESYPEQIFFTHKPGRTRDLREHVRAYALRSNVTWSVRD
jgi:hypothetical protein